LQLFGLGYSWGGYESLLLPVHPEHSRTAMAWTAVGPWLRIHAGLEAPMDLIADLAAGFERLRSSASPGL
ncbi:MAG: cystathionine beta-lyase, partial [Candidatus Macondimonas sp.]